MIYTEIHIFEMDNHKYIYDIQRIESQVGMYVEFRRI